MTENPTKDLEADPTQEIELDLETGRETETDQEIEVGKEKDQLKTLVKDQ